MEPSRKWDYRAKNYRTQIIIMGSLTLLQINIEISLFLEITS